MIDEECISTSQIKKLTEKNYRSWATNLCWILWEKEVFDIIEGLTTAPAELPISTMVDEHTAYNAELKKYQKKAIVACRILISAILSRLITYAEDYNYP